MKVPGLSVSSVLSPGVELVIVASCLALTSTVGRAEWADYVTRWAYYRPIEIQAAQVSGGVDLDDFPVLISLSNDWLRTTANGGHVMQSDGSDIVFSSQDGSVDIDHEVERYDGTLGMLDAWARVPTLDHDDNTTIIMWYGRDASYARNPSNVWDSDYVMVQHMDDDPDTSHVTGSTTNAMSGVKEAANEPNEVDAKIAKGQDGDGVNDDIDCGTSLILNPNEAITVEHWLWMRTTAVAQVSVDRNNVYRLFVNSGGRMYFYVHVNGSWNNGQGNLRPYVPATGVWHHVAMVYDSSDGILRAYTNGASAGTLDLQTSVYLTTQTLFRTYIGSSGGNYVNGVLDEVRISKVARSADWIATEHSNQSDPASFYNLGAEIEVPPMGSLFLVR